MADPTGLPGTEDAWMARLPQDLRPIVARCAAGEMSPVMTLMHLAWEYKGPDLPGRLREACSQAPGQPCLHALAQLAAENRPGLDLVRRVQASGLDHAPAASVEEGIASAKAMFDRIAAFSPEAGSALYSFGSKAILDAATNEVAAVLGSWVTLAGRDVLDIGCGAGRCGEVLADLVATVTGIDVSEAMIAAARVRCAGHANLCFLTSSGRDLNGLPCAGFDLVLAVDSFPYLVRSGMALAARHFFEAARVLRPGGDLVLFNFSYRGDAAADRNDVARMARDAGFLVVRSGVRPFHLWDGVGYHLRRPPVQDPPYMPFAQA